MSIFNKYYLGVDFNNPDIFVSTSAQFMLFLGSVRPPYLTLSVCDGKKEDNQKIFVTLAGGRAAESSKLPLVTVSQIFPAYQAFFALFQQ